ncbi:rubredoxin [Segetibacter koreensis]|uniref:rubredoxin n=1 Tax=Segetibacter koreensis TaxID=398037 RepID=UPI000369F744|nr:rubredoxin [Segetibacter koreensis]
MASTETIYINFTGGIVSPGYLKKVLEIAALAKVNNVRFGLRQQILLDIPVKQFPTFSHACVENNIEFARKKEAHPNIVSSYPAVDIFTTDTWVREGVYKDIFNSFDYIPKVKINITDSNQTFVPFFTGHVNWISSASSHFWYLYVRFPKTEKVYCFPELVYTNDIAAVAKQVEKILASKHVANERDLYKQLKTLPFISKQIERELELPKFSLPYYEGFNKYDNNYWLGIYRREEAFPVQFLSDVCSICMKTKIGQMYTTPWKSIIIKGIETKDRNLWDYALGKYRINVRHAANELNWQIEDNCEDGLQLKRHIIRYFDKEDVRTYGLSFAVKTRPFSSMPGSIIVRKQDVKNPGRLKALERFEILYTSNFNPNSSNFISFRKDVEKEHLGTYLVSLCKYFYERESEEKTLSIESFNLPANNVSDITPVKIVHQCKHCFTIFDEGNGDAENNIAPGTSFNDLPVNYKCSLCESDKEDFIAVNVKNLQLY